MKYLFILTCQLSLIISALGEEPAYVEKYRASVVKRWEKDMQRIDALNKSETHPENSILFVGSSSIRLWEWIDEDMSPYHPIERGFGGSKISDLAVFADRLITPHKFRAVVIFVANDITGRDGDKTVAEIGKLFTYFHGKIRKHNPTAPIFYIGVTPTASRAKVWTESKAANTAIREICADTKDTYFIGTESIFLDAKGKSRNEFFRADKLHLNETGYDLWAAAIKSQLDTVFDGAK